MSENTNPDKLQEIINDFNNQKLDLALDKLNLLKNKFSDTYIVNKLFASIYFKKMDWKKSIKYYEKNLIYEKEKFKNYLNIGIAYFKQGEIGKSIDAYKKSIEDNSNFEITYGNLGISLIEIGKYEDAIYNFLTLMKLNKNNNFAKKNIINLFNFIDTKKIENNSLIKINNNIRNIVNTYKIKDFNNLENLKRILIESDNIIKNYEDNLNIEETQLYRKNSQNLNCKRHFNLFNKFNVISKYCFSCYKVQVILNSVIDLIRLYFIFDNINLENNNIRKCMVELRDNIKGNYKGYVYCSGLDETKKILKKLNLILNKNDFENFEITIKHGCSEYYKTYPKFKNINFNGNQEFQYNEEWKEKEILIDKLEPTRSQTDKKVLIDTIRGLNLSDVLIIKNWINYACLIGDSSYKKIYDKKINNAFMNKALQKQLNFRIEDLKK